MEELWVNNLLLKSGIMPCVLKHHFVITAFFDMIVRFLINDKLIYSSCAPHLLNE